MPRARKSETRRRLRLAVLNDSQAVLKMLCEWFERHGHECRSAVVADMPLAHVQVEKFLSSEKPDVVVYDVAMPYASNWDLLDVIRELPSLKSLPFVVTTPNKRELDASVGKKTRALPIGGRATDLTRLLKAVERAASTPSARQ